MKKLIAITILLLSITTAYTQNWNIAQVGILAPYWETANKVNVEGNYAYIASGSTGLRIIDISNSASPVETGYCFTSGSAQDVAVSGDYVYVADAGGGLRIIDVSDPEAPFEAGYCNLPGSANGVKVTGDYAYISSGEAGLRIINISNPHNPFEIGFCDTPNSALDVAVSGNYAYVADNDAGLRIINISDPFNPAETGCFDSTCARSVVVRDSLAYVAADYDGLWILNVGNPAAPFSISHCYLAPPGWGATQDIVLQGDYAYTATPWYGMHIIDIANPYSPIVVGNEYACYPHGVAVAGDFAYLAMDSPNSSLNVIDISNPSTPCQVGSYGWDNIFYAVAVSDTLAYTANSSGGLQVINITDPASPRLITGCPVYGWGSCGIAVSGSYAYVTYCGYGEGGLNAVDISDPYSPHPLSYYMTYDYGADVKAAGNYAYLAASGVGLVIIDISNPNSLTGVGTCPTGGYATGVALSSDYAYVADLWGGLRIINVVDPSNPFEVGNYSSGGLIGSVDVLGDYAYIADGTLQVLDVSNPANPLALSTLEIPAEYVVVSDNFAFVTDSDSGLYVIDVSNPYYPLTVGHFDTPGLAMKSAIAGNLIYIADYYNFGIYDCSEAMTQPLDLTLTPINPPIIIPSGGGAFGYNIAAVNNGGSLLTFDVWVSIEVPGGYQFTILGPVLNNTLGAGSSIQRDRTVSVPGRTPAGEYLCMGIVGIYPWTVIASDAFPFIKEGEAGTWIDSAGWLSGGEPFPEEGPISHEGIPEEFTFFEVFPNPFNPSTVISFELREASYVSLDIFDVTGRSVGAKNLSPFQNQYLPAGQHSVTFNAEGLTSGVYFIRLEAGEYDQTQKMLLVK